MKPVQGQNIPATTTGRPSTASSAASSTSSSTPSSTSYTGDPIQARVPTPLRSAGCLLGVHLLASSKIDQQGSERSKAPVKIAIPIILCAESIYDISMLQTILLYGL